jgi:hypothetical protein
MVMKRSSPAAGHPAHTIRLVIEVEANLASSKATREALCDVTWVDMRWTKVTLWRIGNFEEAEHTTLHYPYLWEA